MSVITNPWLLELSTSVRHRNNPGKGVKGGSMASLQGDVLPFRLSTSNFISLDRTFDDKSTMMASFMNRLDLVLKCPGIWFNIICECVLRVSLHETTSELIGWVEQITLLMWVALTQSIKGLKRSKYRGKGEFDFYVWVPRLAHGLSPPLDGDLYHWLSTFRVFGLRLWLHHWLCMYIIKLGNVVFICVAICQLEIGFFLTVFF